MGIEANNSEVPVNVVNEPPAIGCAFCGKSLHQVRRLLQGLGYVKICDVCIMACAEIIKEKRQEEETIKAENEKAAAVTSQPIVFPAKKKRKKK